jgi:hypothetical protein
LHVQVVEIGKKDFNLLSISEKKWVFIEGLFLVLTPLKLVTSYLSGEKYPTFTQVLPLLRRLKTFWMSSQDNLFSEDSSCAPIAEYVKLHEKSDRVDEVVIKLKVYCTTFTDAIHQALYRNEHRYLVGHIFGPSKQTDATSVEFGV